MTRRMTAAQLVASHNKASRNGKGRVRGAQPTEVDGIRFPSKLEARRWTELRLLERAGRISDLHRQVSIVLQGRDGPILTPGGRPMRYVADFVYRETGGGVVIEDAKGWKTDVFEMKRAILAAQGVTVRLIRKSDTGTGTWQPNDATALHRKIVGPVDE